MMQLLSEYFGFTQWEPNYIITGPKYLFLMVEETSMHDKTIFEKINIIKYTETIGKGFKKMKVTMYVCFIKYNRHLGPNQLHVVQSLAHAAHSVICLTGKYPYYVKDQFNSYTTNLQGQPARDVLNADLNRWQKHILLH